MINYVDKMADALVDVLKYSNQDVEWVEPDDMKPNDGVQPEWFYPAIENAEYSEIPLSCNIPSRKPSLKMKSAN